MKTYVTTAVLLTAAFASGCASIFTGTSDPVVLNSTPPGATIEINGNLYGRTPTTVELGRSWKPQQVQFSLAGHEPQTMTIQKTFNPVTLLNIFFYPGVIVDLITASVMKYDRLYYEAALQPHYSAQSSPRSPRTDAGAGASARHGDAGGPAPRDDAEEELRIMRQEARNSGLLL